MFLSKRESNNLASEVTKLKADLEASEELNAKLQKENQELRAENAELRKLPAAETSKITAEKEAARAGETSVKLATSDENSFMENLDAVKKEYL
jgi:hypothetical protein